MQYLDMVINEAIRMYPPGFVLVNEIVDTKFWNYFGLNQYKSFPLLGYVYF